VHNTYKKSSFQQLPDALTVQIYNARCTVPSAQKGHKFFSQRGKHTERYCSANGRFHDTLMDNRKSRENIRCLLVIKDAFQTGALRAFLCR